MEWPLNEVIVMYRFSKKVSLSNVTLKLPWAKQTFYKVGRSCKQLDEMGNHLTKFIKFAILWSSQNSPTTLQKLWDWQTTSIKFIEAANNFKKLAEVRKKFAKFIKFVNNLMKFVGLINNFYEVRRSCKQLYKVCGARL